MRRADLIKDTIALSFYVRKDEFGPELLFIKDIENRFYDPISKKWYIPLSLQNIVKIKKRGYELSPELKSYYEDSTRVEIPEVSLVSIDETKLLPGLRDYQIEGVRFLETYNGRGLIAFVPRLGKSLTALAWCNYRGIGKILIVCPSISKPVWKQEVEKWTTLTPVVLSGRSPHSFEADVVIINYDILKEWVPSLYEWDYKVIIIDESHYASNKLRSTTVKDADGVGHQIKVPVQRTKAVQQLASKVPHVICLSGTPFLSYPAQMFITLNILNNKLFNNEYKYLYHFCDPVKTKWGWEFKGATNVSELKAKLSTIMLRKAKEDVFDSLPEEEHIVLPIEIDRQEYEEEWAKFQEWYKKHRGLSEEELDEKLLHLQSISYSKKRTAIHEWIRDFIASGQQLVIFAWFRETCYDLHTVFRKESVLVYGGSSGRTRAIEKFQKGEAQIFIGQISSSKESITLAQSNDVLYAEIPCSAGDLIQSQERVFLPGKLNKNAYYYAVAWNTVDEERYERLMNRVKIMKEVLD